MNKYCPKCKMNFSESFEECPYCEGELIIKQMDKTSNSTSSTTQHISTNTINNKQTNNTGKILLLACGSILLLFLMIQCFSIINKDDNGDDNTCSSCHKTFTNSTDTRSIARTSMCEPCYEDYKFTQELQDEMLKYEERYGN